MGRDKLRERERYVRVGAHSVFFYFAQVLLVTQARSEGARVLH